MNPQFKIKTKFIIVFVLICSVSFILAIVRAKSSISEIKEGRIVINEPLADSSFFISAKVSQNEINSPVLRTDFPFNALYSQWQTDQAWSETANIGLELPFTIYVKFLNEQWSDWQKMEFDDDYNGKDSGVPHYSSQMLTTELTDSFQYKIVLKPEFSKEDLKSLDFIYLDTTKGPKKSFKIAAKTDNLKIISRAEWGADENLRFNDQGQAIWEDEYYTPQKFIIHHTAGESANVDPMASVRAIYYWHAVSKGWGDIGYNYLIDAQGNIYEGRSGGDGIVGGHAYMRNRNTIGIAILGCYQSATHDKAESNCNTPTTLTEATKISLNKLIASKAREFNIDPLGQSEFHGKILPNVIGHSDVGYTVCPGDLIYQELPQTRKLAYNILQELGGYQKPLPTSAEFIRVSEQEVNIEETKTKDITVEFKNTGQAVWRGYEDAGLFIGEEKIKNKLAAIGSVNIALNNTSSSEKILTQYRLQGGNVAPGQIGKFVITLNPPLNQKSVTQKYVLAWQDKGYFPGSDFSLTVNRLACASCQVTNTQAPAPIISVLLAQSTFPDQMKNNNLQPVLLQFQNTGNQILDAKLLKLKIVYEKNHISPFKNDSWYDEWASIPPTETQIAPNSLATFEFKLKSPSLATTFPHTVSVFYNNQELASFDQTIEVISVYAAEITANTIPDSLPIGKRAKVKLTFKNSGSKIWDNIVLKSYDIDYTNSWFKDWSWWDNKTVKKIKQKIEPGQEITFEFRLNPYWKPNTYPQVFKLFNGTQPIQINNATELLLYTKATK
jgi:hypothetical protein